MKGRINVKKRLLAMMMAIVMVMTLLPTSAFAAGGDTGLQEGQVRATKALVLDNENQPVKVNCTPFVRQYGILSNKWGVLLCQREYRTNDTQRNSRSW